MDKKLTEQESLAVINGMIAQARGRIERGEGNYFLLWGYVIAAAALVHYIWLKVSCTEGLEYSNVIWIVAVLIGLALTSVFVMMNRKKVLVKTYSGSVGHTVWIGFGIGCFIISLLLGGRNGAFIYPAISLLYTFALFVSAKVFRFDWLFVNVAICAICVVVYRFVQMREYPLLMSIIMIAGNVIPGHIINYKGRKNV